LKPAFRPDVGYPRIRTNAGNAEGPGLTPEAFHMESEISFV